MVNTKGKPSLFVSKRCWVTGIIITHYVVHEQAYLALRLTVFLAKELGTKTGELELMDDCILFHLN